MNMAMFKSIDEMLEELYEELENDHTIDEIMDALEELAEKYHNEKAESEHDVDENNGEFSECDGDCEHCVYGVADDSDEYEYGGLDNDELAEAYKQAQEDFKKALDEYDNKRVDEYDSVNRPAHYAAGKIEVIDFIEDKELGYNLGNCIKYISRAGKKHENGISDLEKALEDLRKARWYLDREISTLEAEL